jgi:hypothetical protein
MRNLAVLSLSLAVIGLANPAAARASADPDPLLGPAIWRTTGPQTIDVYDARYPYYYGGRYWRYHYGGGYYNYHWRGQYYPYHYYGHYCHHRYYRYGYWRCY